MLLRTRYDVMLWCNVGNIGMFIRNDTTYIIAMVLNMLGYKLRIAMFVQMFTGDYYVGILVWYWPW